MDASTGRAGSGDVNDFDDVCRAQLAHTTFLAQCVVGGIEILVDAEAAGSDVLGVGLGSVGAGVVVGVGMVRSRVGMRRSRVAILHCIYIHF